MFTELEPEISEQDLASLYGGSTAKKQKCEDEHIPDDLLSAIDISITQTAQVKEPEKTASNRQTAQVENSEEKQNKTKQEAPHQKRLESKTDLSRFAKSPPNASANKAATSTIPSPVTPSPKRPSNAAKTSPSPTVSPSPTKTRNPFKRKSNTTSKRFVLNEQKTEVVSRLVE